MKPLLNGKCLLGMQKARGSSPARQINRKKGNQEIMNEINQGNFTELWDMNFLLKRAR